MGMIQKQRNWVPYELKPRDVEWRFFACEQLIQRQKRKAFLHRIVIFGKTPMVCCFNFNKEAAFNTLLIFV